MNLIEVNADDAPVDVFSIVPAVTSPEPSRGAYICIWVIYISISYRSFTN